MLVDAFFAAFFATRSFVVYFTVMQLLQLDSKTNGWDIFRLQRYTIRYDSWSKIMFNCITFSSWFVFHQMGIRVSEWSVWINGTHADAHIFPVETKISFKTWINNASIRKGIGRKNDVFVEMKQLSIRANY